jgi:DUF4097 and DUF4098 domain-containing protein YvlB
MKRNVITLLWCAGLLAVLIISAASAQNRHRHEKDTDDEDSRVRSFTVSKGGSLIVSAGGGSIHIMPWDKNEVHVDVSDDDEDDDGHVHMTMTDNTVRVTNRGDYSSSDAKYEINVPKEFNVDLRTSDGDIRIESGLTGRIEGNTSSGTIRLGDLGGSIDLETSGGDVKAGDIKGDVSLRTSGGDITAGAVDGDAEFETSGGDIRLENVTKSLKASTAGGDVTTGDIGGTADISTSGGTLTIGKLSGRSTLSTSGGDISIAGATDIVSARTAGGGLDLSDIKGSITAKTAGGDIRAELIPSGTGRSRLTTASGDIRLYIPANAKATINAHIRVEGWWRENKDDYHIRSDFKEDSYETNEDDNEIHAVYTLNGGGEVITLETTNADIGIWKLDSTPSKRKGK